MFRYPAFPDPSDDNESSGFDISSLRLGSPWVAGVGTAFPPKRYTQEEVKTLLGIQNRTVHKLLDSKHIQTRHLYLPEPPAPGIPIHEETQEEMIAKFIAGVRDIGVTAVKRAIEGRFAPTDIQFLVCVTSSGFAVPGVTSIIARELSLSQSLYRLDVVGMGCNAGMSALRTAAALAAGGAVGVLLCCEVNSAIYVRDETTRTGIVNSLFGDGAAAVALSPTSALRAPEQSAGPAGKIVSKVIDFETFTLPEQWDAMRFDWNQEQKKWSFGLSREIPFVVGDNLKVPVFKLLERNQIERASIKHWSIHTGGAAVIDGAKRSLGLSEEDVRHTRSVLRDYGNVSSGSFLVSLSRLLEEKTIKNGDLGIWAAMGPGATLEACLVRYSIAE